MQALNRAKIYSFIAEFLGWSVFFFCFCCIPRLPRLLTCNSGRLSHYGASWTDENRRIGGVKLPNTLSLASSLVFPRISVSRDRDRLLTGPPPELLFKLIRLTTTGVHQSAAGGNYGCGKTRSSCAGESSPGTVFGARQPTSAIVSATACMATMKAAQAGHLPSAQKAPGRTPAAVPPR